MTANAGGNRKVLAVDGRTNNERVLKAININPGIGRAPLAKAAGVSEWTVRTVAKEMVIRGWVKTDPNGGWRVTPQGRKTLERAAGGTLQGSPLVGPEGYVVNVPDPHRLHGGRIVGTLDRSVTALDDFLGFQHESLTGVHRVPTAYYRIWMDNGNGRLPVPVQVFKPHDLDKPYKVVVQALNAIHSDMVVGSMRRDVTLEMLMDEVRQLLHSWLGDQSHLLGDLEWRLQKLDVEDAVPVPANAAAIGGNPQTDAVAEDGTKGAGGGSKGTPWEQEQETTLTWKDRIIELEQSVGMLQDTVDALMRKTQEGFLTINDGLDAIRHQQENEK